MVYYIVEGTYLYTHILFGCVLWWTLSLLSRHILYKINLMTSRCYRARQRLVFSLTHGNLYIILCGGCTRGCLFFANLWRVQTEGCNLLLSQPPHIRHSGARALFYSVKQCFKLNKHALHSSVSCAMSRWCGCLP